MGSVTEGRPRAGLLGGPGGGAVVVQMRAGARAWAMSLGSRTPHSPERSYEPDRPQSAASEGAMLSREGQITSVRRLHRQETFSHTEHL
jgi:hypothetical protein